MNKLTEMKARSEKEIVYWCTASPVPYMDDFFLRASMLPHIDIKTVYTSKTSKAHPEMIDAGLGYTWTAIDTYKEFFKIICIATLVPKAKWLIAGWGTKRYIILLFMLILARRNYWLYTDAPIPSGRSKANIVRFLRGLLLSIFFRRARGIIGSGDMAVENLIKMTPTNFKKIYSMPIPLDESRFKVGVNYVPGEEIIVVFSGRIDRLSKRFDLALETFKEASIQLDRDGVRMRLVIAGSGIDMSELKLMVNELKIQDQVDILGWLSQVELSSLYRRAHVYLHTADFEPYGVTVVEAMYSGLYTIASSGVGAARELVIPGKNGALFPIGDTHAASELLVDACKKISVGLSKSDVRQISLRWPLKKILDRAESILVDEMPQLVQFYNDVN